MKIGLSCNGDNLDSQLDERFGRAANFIIYDLENNTYECVSNQQNLNSSQGAGIQSAQTLANTGVEAVITGNVGPKAFRALQSAGIDIYLSSNISVQKAIEKFNKNELKKTESNNVEGHWI